MYDGMKTTELDNLAAETCAYMNLIHPHYSLLAAKLVVDNLHKETSPSFVETAKILYNYIDKAGKFENIYIFKEETANYFLIKFIKLLFKTVN
jgi:hypothetical protein